MDVDELRGIELFTGLTDDQLAELARMSVRASAAPDSVKQDVIGQIDAWLAVPVQSRT